MDGCFWNACPTHATKPRDNAAFWREKLAANKARDRKVNRTLRAAGWRVLRIWEHELPERSVRSGERKAEHLLARLQLALASPDNRRASLYLPRTGKSVSGGT